MQQSSSKRPWPLFLLGILLFALLYYLIYAYSPFSNISLGPLHIPLLIPFFIIVFGGMYSIGAFFFNKALQGFVIAGCVISYLLMRYFGLTHYVFAILLLGVFGSIEFAIYKKK